MVFFTNLIGQEPWELRGTNEARLRALERQNALVDFDAWTTHTPTLTQSAAVTKTVNYSSWTRLGRLIVWQFKITPTAAGTTNNRLLLSPPVAPAATTVGLQIGGGSIYDSSAGTLVFGQWQIFSATEIGFQSQVGDLWGVLPNLPTGINDELKGTVMFEAVS